MKGLVIWANSECRSTMATYKALLAEFNVPSRVVVLYGKQGCGVPLRVRAGFRADEFDDLAKTHIEMDYTKGLSVLDETPGWNHLFCAYQSSRTVRSLILEAKRRGCAVGIMTEAPCNMSSGWRKVLKNAFMVTMLPLKIRSVIRASDFFVNCSGDDVTAHTIARWPRNKIIPFGYFPPPIEGSHCVLRKSNDNFRILATGILSRYRGADVLVDALRILSKRGVKYRATITQEGELLPVLKEKVKRFALPVDFPGFLPMPKLIELYENCSVYVGAGRSEPWGMRLNDALNCGAPLVVSRGMGGAKLVDDYGCGLVFEKGNPVDLANKLERLAADSDFFLKCAKNAKDAAESCSPMRKAKELAKCIRGKSSNWA